MAPIFLPVDKLTISYHDRNYNTSTCNNVPNTARNNMKLLVKLLSYLSQNAQKSV